MSTKLVWRTISLDFSELRLATVLRCGQTFRWKQKGDTFSMAYKGRVLFLKQDEQKLSYSTIPGGKLDNSDLSDLEVIRDYFNLKIKLVDLYAHWSTKDKRFKLVAGDFSGIRILRQDPWENLCSFICSSNNNIKRISLMVQNLCTHFGEFVATYEGVDYYDFPDPSKLAHSSVEQRLRSLGFGYRAKYLQKTAALVQEEGLDGLFTLRDVPYEQCHEALLRYTGVGPKVADCVCLMSLDKHDCIPVDTHIWQIAQRDYKYGRKYKLLNKIAYKDIGDFFRDLWGPYAGWAQSVMFTADLRDLNNGVNMSQLDEIVVKKDLDGIKLEEAEAIKNLDEKPKIKKEPVNVKLQGNKRSAEQELRGPRLVKKLAA